MSNSTRDDEGLARHQFKEEQIEFDKKVQAKQERIQFKEH